jgi:chaperonin GroEL (HSP60 family)
VELAVMRDVQAIRPEVGAMAAYGVDCVLAALKVPLVHIVENAGFNPLEKLEAVQAAMVNSGVESLAIDCDSGEVGDMLSLGVIDPTEVKIHALRAAGEVAEAVLSINVIIRKRDERPDQEGLIGV